MWDLWGFLAVLPNLWRLHQWFSANCINSKSQGPRVLWCSNPAVLDVTWSTVLMLEFSRTALNDGSGTILCLSWVVIALIPLVFWNKGQVKIQTLGLVHFSKSFGQDSALSMALTLFYKWVYLVLILVNQWLFLVIIYVKI